MKLQNRVAVVTGAGSGIGRAIAMSLARRGCHLALADINEAGLQASQRLVQAQSSGARVTIHRLDVADREAVRSFPAWVVQEHGRCDVLVNNAGVAVSGYFEQVEEADFEWLMEINFHGLVRMTRAFLPLLRESDDARLVNLSSLYGLVSSPGQVAYSSSKFAVRGFSNGLRIELANTSVGVTVAHPGGVATSISASARAPKGMSEEEFTRRKKASEKLLRMPAEEAGEIIVRAMEARKDRVIVGSDAKFVAWLERLMPVGYWNVLGRLMKK